MKNYLATLSNMCHVPPGSISRGDGKFDFKADKLPDIAKELLKEVAEDGKVEFVKKDEKTKTSVELVKEGKPIAKPVPVKPVKPIEAPVKPDTGGGKKP